MSIGSQVNNNSGRKCSVEANGEEVCICLYGECKEELDGQCIGQWVKNHEVNVWQLQLKIPREHGNE